MFPDDPRTNEDFFFNRIRTPHDKTHLFGLYVGILKYLEVNPSTLHEWRLSGTMVTNIKALYEVSLALPWFYISSGSIAADTHR
jgi:Zn-dependent protease